MRRGGLATRWLIKAATGESTSERIGLGGAETAAAVVEKTASGTFAGSPEEAVAGAPGEGSLASNRARLKT